ncbi:MAG: hypothetical protein JM58_12150 [Peptococcaceae bacterium BICA1-8]|nr:MAG: hypothetical protein JM58_12150 [Peptococcaceae bacterium BICA1-8]
MKNGAIVRSTNDNDGLFRLQGIINGKEGRKIAILEELCKNSTKAKFADLNSLSLVWSPRCLKDSLPEYDITSYDENILFEKTQI